MKDPTALVINPRESKAIELRENLARYKPLHVDVVVARSFEAYRRFNADARNDENIQLCFLPYSTTSESISLVDQIERKYPLANIVFTSPGRGETAPAAHSELKKMFPNSSVVGFLEDDRLIEDLPVVLDNLRSLGDLTRQLNVYINGGGTLGQGIISLLKSRRYVGHVGLLSESAEENKPFPPSKFSYNHIEVTLSLDDLINEGRYTTYIGGQDRNAVEAWATDAAQRADMVIFTSSPHVHYGDQNIRGKEAEHFEDFLFRGTYPKMRRAVHHLRRAGYNNFLQILSNPIGSLCQVAIRGFEDGTSGFDPSQVSSRTCDGVRVGKQVCKEINEAKIGRTMREALKIRPRDIVLAPLVGEHHFWPIPLFDLFSIQVGSEVININDLYPAFRNVAYRQRFMEALLGKGSNTVRAARILKRGYVEAPEAFVESLDAMAVARQEGPLSTTYRWDESLGGFIQGEVAMLEKVPESKKARLLKDLRLQVYKQKKKVTEYF